MKKLTLLIAAAITALAGNAQLLWKVEGNGAKEASYIFGTHHIAPVTLLETTPGLADALSGADVVYGEIDMQSAADPVKTQQLMMQLAMAPSDSTMTKLMTQAQIDSVNAVLAKYTQGALTVEQMDIMKPSLLATQIGVMQTMTAFPDFTGQDQLDNTVQVKARELGRQVKGFETLEFQTKMLLDEPIADQIEGLMQSVRKDDIAVKKAQELAMAYLLGNLESVEALMFDPEVGMDEKEAERLIYSRNADWVEQMVPAMAADKLFVAVGCGHLVGEKGLIELLRKAGYTVTPVK
ncbi:MAG: TraB/GumN family protein [Muribaculum sp.]|nr:TraB/GumN family protein [Muribaculum sp.]